MKQLKSGFKRTINWSKCQSKVTIKRQNEYLDYLIDMSFQGVDRNFILSFEDNAVRTGHTIKDYNIMTDRQNVLMSLQKMI